jgi:2-isopropylmalate synthase
MADAATVLAVFAGAEQIQGTINGIGERCGNANIATCIANLQLKKGYTLIPEGKLRILTKASRAVAQICNFSINGVPYVSRNAFAHKAGTHIDAVMKDTSSYEHTDPALIGNKRNILVSGLSGRSAILPLLQAFAPELDRQSPEMDKLLDIIKEHESLGYQYESAHASLELLIRKTLGIHKSHFRVERFKLFTEQTEFSESNAPVLDTQESKAHLPMGLSSAFVKISVDEKTEMTAAESDGPVDALDAAIRKALYVFYPHLKDVGLVDYKVRIIDGSSAAGATVRVMIDTSNGSDIFTTVGVSTDIIEASKQAIIDSLEYALYKYNA